MFEIEKYEDKIRLLVIELLKEINRNVHIEIDAECINKTVKIKLNLSKTFK